MNKRCFHIKVMLKPEQEAGVLCRETGYIRRGWLIGERPWSQMN